MEQRNLERELILQQNQLIPVVQNETLHFAMRNSNMLSSDEGLFSQIFSLFPCIYHNFSPIK
jgi:hypothetical protein